MAIPRLHSVRRLKTMPQRSGSPEVLGLCYCAEGHRLNSPAASFKGHDGISVLLKNERREGLLSLSPIVGDRSRRFFFSDRVEGEVFSLCCPTCREPFPIYNICSCGAYLSAVFTSPVADMANCIGLCQRIGCLHSDILSNRDLRLYSRNGFY